MRDTTPSAANRFFSVLLLLYAFFMVLYLSLRFLIRLDYNLVNLIHNLAPYLFIPVLLGILLAFLIGARRLGLFYLLLLLIGAVWIGLPLLMALLVRPTSASGDTALKIISFNLYPENTEHDEAEGWLASQDADLLFLQEVPSASDLADLRALYPHEALQTGDVNYLTLSRYPILETGELELGENPQQRLVLDVNGLQVAVYNVHLSMPLNENENQYLLLRYDESRRNTEIRELLAHAALEDLPVLILGDFNMSEYSPVYDSLAAEFEDAYRVSQWGIGATWPASASEELEAGLPRLFRLDYLWYQAGFQALDALVGPELGSDHLPLIIELAFP